MRSEGGVEFWTRMGADLGNSAQVIAESIIARHGNDRASLERVRDSFIAEMEKPGAHVLLNQVAVKLDAHLDTLPPVEYHDRGEVIAP